jgi:hypothetical protein
MYRNTVLIGLLVVLTLAAGCKSKSEECGEGSEEGGEEGGEGCEKAAEPSAAEVPAALLDIEGVAEDAYDKALLADYAAVAKAAAALDKQWKAFRATAKKDGAAASDLAALDAAVAGLIDAADTTTSEASVGRAANAISAPMDELFALYDPTVPVDVLALDYLGREVVLDAMEMDFSAATRDVDTIDTTWKALQQSVVDAGGKSEAADYASSIADMRADIKAKDDTKLTDDANVGLEIVDAIEGVFAP